MKSLKYIVASCMFLSMIDLEAVLKTADDITAAVEEVAGNLANTAQKNFSTLQKDIDNRPSNVSKDQRTAMKKKSAADIKRRLASWKNKNLSDRVEKVILEYYHEYLS